MLCLCYKGNFPYLQLTFAGWDISKHFFKKFQSQILTSSKQSQRCYKMINIESMQKYYLLWKLILMEIEKSISVNFCYGLFYLPSLWNMVFAFSKTYLSKNKAVLWLATVINKTEIKVMYSVKSQWQWQKEHNHTLRIYVFLSRGFW